MTKLLTRKQAADLLGISLPTLDIERRQGRLAFIQTKPNGKVWITEESIDRYLFDMTHKARIVAACNVETLRNVRR